MSGTEINLLEEITTEMNMLEEIATEMPVSEERARPNYAEVGVALVRSLGLTMGQMGEMGQVGLVWFSMGIAVWQLLLIARNLMASGAAPLRNFLGRSLLDVGKTKLVSENTRSIIEMTYWMIKFMEDFEKQYKISGIGENKAKTILNGEGKIWSSNSRTWLKLMRYVTKLLSNQDRFLKLNRPKNIAF